MDSISQWDTLTPLFLAFCGIFAVAWYARIFFTKPSPNLPPGPPGLPLFGNLLSLDPELHSYFASLSQTYGPIFSLRLGTQSCIVFSSPSIARQVLKDHDITFANRDVPIAGRLATYGGNDIAWSRYGPEWRMLRKVCALKMLSNTTLDSVYQLRRTEIRKTVRYLYSRVGSPVDIGKQIFLTILNVTTSMMWGRTMEGDERAVVGAEFREVVAHMTELLGKPNMSDFFPGLARFDLQGVEKQMRSLVPRLDQIFEKMIKLRLGRDSDGGTEEESKDFLQFLLKLKDEENSKTPLTMTHVKALLMDMVVGGSDTTSNAIDFALAHIINEPEVMKRVQEELDNIVGRENTVEESHIHKLPCLLAVMKETLRLHPALPLLVPHCPSETTIIEGYTVPKGSRVFVNVWAIHRDPLIWNNPLQFDPIRFLDAKWDFSGNDFDYFPFGSGRRMCAGIAMAERTFLYSMATLMHSFDWKVVEGQELDMSEKFGIVLKKRVPLAAIPTPRLSNPTLYE
ncbi:flavonoid 3'-monooxygenase CYP75B137-like [Prosopis cineraria]|uniref:flavonoid 3'-monooxygenase CYP75B137-like n=1 Tax=Prosopis cineraria TaxID=364024 RepID=UPI00240FE22C|nr:flavonoid 3'-monooxygenase CYP75B137-like [Prosopis cineraria]